MGLLLLKYFMTYYYISERQRCILSLPSEKVSTVYTCKVQNLKKRRSDIEIKQQNSFIRAGTSEKER